MIIHTSQFRVLMTAVSVLVCLALPMPSTAQEDVLQSTNPDVRILRTMRGEFSSQGLDPFDNPITRMSSPDSQALELIDNARSEAQDELRAVIDLLAVYENLQCHPDRATVKPLLEDRLGLYSRLLDLNAKWAADLVSTPKIIQLAATSKKALKLHDDLLAAKNKLDAIANTLK
jgi:hypothetical protein